MIVKMKWNVSIVIVLLGDSVLLLFKPNYSSEKEHIRKNPIKFSQTENVIYKTLLGFYHATIRMKSEIASPLNPAVKLIVVYTFYLKTYHQ